MFSLQLWLSCPLYKDCFSFLLEKHVSLRQQRRLKNRLFSILSGHPGNGQSRAIIPKLWLVSPAVKEVPLLQAAFKAWLSSVLQTKSKFGVEVKAGERPQSRWLWLSTHDSETLPPHHTFLSCPRCQPQYRHKSGSLWNHLPEQGPLSAEGSLTSPGKACGTQFL